MAGDERARLVRAATYASTSVALTLVLAKLGAWALTGSVSLLSSLVDSALDLVASAITWLAVRHAMNPADREHRFGHGKAEALAALAQAGFILASVAGLLLAGIERLMMPHPIVREEIGIAVSVLAIVLTGGLAAFQRHVVRRTASVAIAADALHYRSDLLVNLAVVVTLLVTARYGIVWLDSVTAIAIALYLLVGVRAIIGQALDVLMDRELPQADRLRIEAIVHAHPAARHLHGLRTRSSGLTQFIELHVAFDPDLSLAVVHRYGDEIEAGIKAAFPQAEVLLHHDPFGLEVPERDPT
ncbi:MAG: cation diffusion facilitator family transporter [Alphaproteobacteria bacterium]|nr:cation diffusion facilitator family transporter [Alphaproteobacteria bacterium]MCW5739325.1 cation diffusion facilitator family transporter [Alphaproteobacteria bacterium]